MQGMLLAGSHSFLFSYEFCLECLSTETYGLAHEGLKKQNAANGKPAETSTTSPGIFLE